MGWESLDTLFRQDTEEEAEWAAAHAPNLSKAPRGWKPTAFVRPEDTGIRSGESQRDQVARLSDKGYSPTAISVEMGVGSSRIGQILHVIREERDRVGVLESS